MFDRLVVALRELASGLSRPTASCCSGDPIAWEKDWARRRREERPTPAAATAGLPLTRDRAADSPASVGR